MKRGFQRAAGEGAVGIAVALAIAGCGGADKAAPTVAAPAAPAPQKATPTAAAPKTPAPVAAAEKKPAPAARDAGASAEEVARQARGDLACPPKIATPARAEKAPVDDVLGVRPGKTYEEAMNLALCAHPLLVATPAGGRGFNLKVPQGTTLRQGFAVREAEPRVVKTSKQIMKEMQDEMTARSGNAVRENLKPGQTRWFVGTMGLPGQERVLSVAREERYAADQSPTVDNLTAALLQKYGKPTRNQRGTGGQLPFVVWAYDPLGRPVTETSPLYNKCTGSSDPDGGVHLSPDCGLVVQAMLVPHRTNPELVERLQVGVVDQAGGYRLITATEQAFGQAEQQRRAQEVERAAKNTKAPKL
jgi:hypothetical protein